MRLFTGLIGLGLALGFSTGVAAQFIPGDINDDGMVDVLDPTVLRRHLADLCQGTPSLTKLGDIHIYDRSWLILSVFPFCLPYL